jgi:Secretion system C-terminal sorting domain
MKKYLLILYMSLQAFLCSAQASADSNDLPAPDVTGSDTSNLLSDLISAVNENTKVVLRWKKSKFAKTDFITVERSNSGNDFEVVAVLKQLENGTSPTEWVDDAPSKGKNIYRVRYAGKSGQQVYTNIASSLITGDTSFRFYPNPVDNILIIRTDSFLDMQIVDGTGKVRVSQNAIQGLQTINVANLEKGLYFLRINNRTTGIITQEKLLKN